MDDSVNERIKLLAEQADNFANDKIQMPGEYHPDWHDVRDEKFAELIVKECALTAGLMEHEGRPNIGRQILDNFGVES